MRQLLAVLVVSVVVPIVACVHRPTPITGHAAIDRLIDSAGTARLATAPLVRKAQEGFAKHAADSTILRALHYVIRECTASPPEMKPVGCASSSAPDSSRVR